MDAIVGAEQKQTGPTGPTGPTGSNRRSDMGGLFSDGISTVAKNICLPVALKKKKKPVKNESSHH